jgi:hypothetical protein
MTPDDYLGRDDLLALGIGEADVDRLLRGTPLSGHGGRPIVESEGLAELVEQRHRDRGTGQDERRW